MPRDAYHQRLCDPQPGAPLVLALHGTGGDETQFFDLARALVPRAGVIAPRGDVSEMGAARFFRRLREGVYDMDDLATRTTKMIEYVAAHRSAHPGAPLYAFGYSNGANILASAVMAAPELFDRIALLHPLVPWSPAPVAGLAGRRVQITAGRNDPITPWPMTETLIAWFAEQQAAVTTHLHDGGHELRETELLALTEFLSG